MRRPGITSLLPTIRQSELRPLSDLFCRCRSLLYASAIIFALLAHALAQAAPDPNPAGKYALHIAAGDLVELTVFDTPELSGRLRVSETGEVVAPVIGAVPVSGLTAEEAAAAIERSLRSHDVLKDPHATIFVLEYATQGVTVTGEVKNPGIYPLLGQHTLMDLISAAGGVTSKAGTVVTLTHKADVQHPQILHIDNRPGSVFTQVDIRPGDTVSVAHAGVIYVVGDVGRAGGFLIETGQLTALQAIALAQGANKTAAPDSSRLIRTIDSHREEMVLPVKKIIAGKAIDPPLRDGDIIYIPNSSAKTWGGRAIDTAIALTTGLAVYGRL